MRPTAPANRLAQRARVVNLGSNGSGAILEVGTKRHGERLRGIPVWAMKRRIASELVCVGSQSIRP